MQISLFGASSMTRQSTRIDAHWAVTCALAAEQPWSLSVI